MKKGILFDVDGTLWDSAPQVTEAWNEILASCPDAGKTITADDMYRYMGHPMDVIGQMMLPDMEEARRKEIMERCMEYENRYLLKCPGALYPGVARALTELAAEYELYIVSNCQDGYIQVLLTACGLKGLIRDFECFGRTGKQKGDNIRLVVERNGLDAAIYVGDTAMDEAAAEAAGLPFVHAAYGFGKAAHPAAVIQSMDELASAARAVFSGKDWECKA